MRERRSQAPFEFLQAPFEFLQAPFEFLQAHQNADILIIFRSQNLNKMCFCRHILNFALRPEKMLMRPD
jgi:hypothetical protein